MEQWRLATTVAKRSSAGFPYLYTIECSETRHYLFSVPVSLPAASRLAAEADCGKKRKKRRVMMSSISMVEASLPPGFRFHPRDDELVMDYLCRKLSGKGGGAYGGIDMIDVDLNKCEPWDLPGACALPPLLCNFFLPSCRRLYNCSAGILHHWKLQLSWCRHMKTSV
jgi:hypothetical protein